jgi:hypothetical protein
MDQIISINEDVQFLTEEAFYRASYTLHRPLIVMHKDNVHFYQRMMNLYTVVIPTHQSTLVQRYY